MAANHSRRTAVARIELLILALHPCKPTTKQCQKLLGWAYKPTHNLLRDAGLFSKVALSCPNRQNKRTSPDRRVTVDTVPPVRFKKNAEPLDRLLALRW